MKGMSKSGLIASTVLAVLTVAGAGCGKLSTEQKQAASDIVSGLAGDTGSDMSQSAGLRAPDPAREGSLRSYLRNQVQGAMWLTRFRLMDGNRADLTLNSGICSTGAGAGICTGSCNSAMTIYTATCTVPTSADLTCNGTTYNFDNTTLSVTTDFTNTGGSIGSATGDFVVGISIKSDVSGGALTGKTLECAMNFTVDIAALKAGTLNHFSPTCDGSFSCKYDGKDLGCTDVQTQMASSTLSCT